MEPGPRIGIVYAPGMASVLAQIQGAFDVLEIEPQTLSPALAGVPGAGPPSARDLGALDAFQHRKVVHSVGLPFGNEEWPSTEEYGAVRFTAEALDSPWVSDHLSFNRDRGNFAGFLLPLPQTPGSVRAAAARIMRLRREVARPVLFETGANYLQPRRDELSDGAYFRAVAEEADCGILLDLHNVWTNERNGRQPVDELVGDLPADRVLEMHIAGGHSRKGYWLDAHSDLASPELLQLAERVLSRLPALQQITFEISPDYLPVRGIGAEALAEQLQALRQLASRSRRRMRPQRERRFAAAGTFRSNEIDDWRQALTLLVNGRSVDSHVAMSLSEDPGLDLYGELVAVGRLGQLAGLAPLTLRFLQLLIGSAELERVLEGYRKATWPANLPLDEVQRFAAFLSTSDEPINPLVLQVLRFEVASLQTASDGQARTVEFYVEPLQLLDGIGAGRLPPQMAATQRYELTIEPTRTGNPGPGPDGGVRRQA